MIHIKTKEEIALMRESGKILAEILHELALFTHVGIQTRDINLKAEALMAHHNVVPSFKGYHGYPGVVCTSINDEIVHAIPGKREIKDGDIIKIDCGVIHKGWHSDSAVCVLVGNVEPRVRTFVNDVQKAFEKGLAEIKPGNRLGDIGFAVQHAVESKGYSVVRDFIGHGIGREMHEAPEVHNVGKKGKGPLLVPGMVIALEPIISMGERFSYTLKDGWTALTKDGSPACQIEHTIAILESGNEVLTKYNGTINNVYSQ